MSGNGQTDRQTRSLVPLSAASFLSHRWKPFYRTQRAEECEGEERDDYYAGSIINCRWYNNREERFDRWLIVTD